MLRHTCHSDNAQLQSRHSSKDTAAHTHHHLTLIKAAAHLQATSTQPSPTPTDIDMVEVPPFPAPKRPWPAANPEPWHLRRRGAEMRGAKASRRIHMPNPGA